eukprot:TRINITY_DN22007_c0_g1_i1.p1 TRINITY_DN22007_c0_g1~~TRINITY_DN22007_c0_g1_i1.p1  ORF type:complete len:178 (+),score=29.61 TRINITY_DN22007_c0_g1_i1:47-580(+)
MDGSRDNDLTSIARATLHGAAAGAVIRVPLSFFSGRSAQKSGGELLAHMYKEISNGAKGMALLVFSYKFSRYLLRKILGGGSSNFFTAFLSGGISSLVVSYLFSDTARIELFFFALKYALEASVKSAGAKGTSFPPYAFAAVNFITWGLFYYFVELEPSTVRGSIVKFTRKLNNDAV